MTNSYKFIVPTPEIAHDVMLPESWPIQNSVVQSIELQGIRGGTGKSRQNSRGTEMIKSAGAAPFRTVQLTAITGAEVELRL